MASATIEHTMTNQQFEDVIDVAAYGAVDYWVSGLKYTPASQEHGPKLVVIDEDNEQFVITKPIMEKAMLDLWTGKIEIREDIQKSIQCAIFEEEYGEIDSTAADCIIQAACFNEIIYG